MITYETNNKYLMHYNKNHDKLGRFAKSTGVDANSKYIQGRSKYYTKQLDKKMTTRRAKKLLRGIQQDRIYDEDIAKNIVKRDAILDRYIAQKGYTDKAKKKEAKIVKDMQTSVADAKVLKAVIDEKKKKIGDNQLSVYQSNDATRMYNKSRRTSVALGDAAVSGLLAHAVRGADGRAVHGGQGYAVSRSVFFPGIIDGGARGACLQNHHHFAGDFGQPRREGRVLDVLIPSCGRIVADQCADILFFEVIVLQSVGRDEEQGDIILIRICKRCLDCLVNLVDCQVGFSGNGVGASLWPFDVLQHIAHQVQVPDTVRAFLGRILEMHLPNQ